MQNRTIYEINQEFNMPRQSVSLTEPNAEWIKYQINSKEYSSISDAINDLIRQARRKEDEKIEKIQAMLIEAEKNIGQNGLHDLDAREQLERFKERAKKCYKL